MSGIKVNVSTKEAGSAPLDPIPSGKYRALISDCELREVKSTAKGNQGKPFYNFEFTIQEDGKNDQYAGRKVWSSVLLFEGALYSLVQLLKALGVPVDEDSGQFQVPGFEANEVPETDWFVGKEMDIKVKLQPERKHPTKPDETLDPRNEVRGYYALGGAGTAVSGGSVGVTVTKPQSVLP